MIRIAALGLACLALAACSIDKRSSAFSCTTTSQCDTGRQCVDGFCVLSGSAGSPDAPIARMDGSVIHDDAPEQQCPPQCATCSVAEQTCNIDCTTTNCDSAVVQCPVGYTCTIACGMNQSCRKGIDCTMAKACSIECSGQQSCSNIECGSGACDVMCIGPKSCTGTLDCGDSCACDIACSGNQACLDAQSTCGQMGACIGDQANSCSSTLDPTLCDTCP
ncbi:MAG TPA: hypothetical protein VH143_14570 [Kofleriaceae bacterium]|nr:hypothetical protein [Kofleriaceae bacterium]